MQIKLNNFLIYGKLTNSTGRTFLCYNLFFFQKRQIYREAVIPRLGGRIPNGALLPERLRHNAQDSVGIEAPDALAFQPRYTTLAFQPRYTTLAFQPRYTTHAFQPRYTTLAFQPRYTTLAFQPRYTTLAFQPRYTTLAFQPRYTSPCLSTQVHNSCLSTKVHNSCLSNPGTQLLPFNPGTQLLPFNPGTQLLPFNPGTQLLPFNPGTQLLPYNPGTQLLPFNQGTQLLPFNPGTKLLPFNPGKTLQLRMYGLERIMDNFCNLYNLDMGQKHNSCLNTWIFPDFRYDRYFMLSFFDQKFVQTISTKYQSYSKSGKINVFGQEICFCQSLINICFTAERRT